MKQNQLNCAFMTRGKGKCKYDDTPCELRPLLIKNGTDNKKKLLVVFLTCYQRNLKQSTKNTGEKFFRTVFKKVTQEQMKPLSEYETHVLLDILEKKPSRVTCMFRIPENILRFEKIWNK